MRGTQRQVPRTTRPYSTAGSGEHAHIKPYIHMASIKTSQHGVSSVRGRVACGRKGAKAVGTAPQPNASERTGSEELHDASDRTPDESVNNGTATYAIMSRCDRDE